MLCLACLAMVNFPTQPNTILNPFRYMFSLYIPAVFLMVVLTLQDVKKTKRKNPKKRNTTMVGKKKTGGLDGPENLLINGLTGILLRGVGFLGSFPHQF